MKMPPIAKIYEAYSAYADGRVVLHEKEALVTSSNDSKVYTVTFNDHQYTSNDNATLWQHYPGYPIIAVWMKQNHITVNEKVLPLFENINWKKWNTVYKNRYALAIEAFYASIICDRAELERIMQDCYEQIEKLPFEIKANHRKLLAL